MGLVTGTSSEIPLSWIHLEVSGNDIIVMHPVALHAKDCAVCSHLQAALEADEARILQAFNLQTFESSDISNTAAI